MLLFWDTFRVDYRHSNLQSTLRLSYIISYIYLQYLITLPQAGCGWVNGHALIHGHDRVQCEGGGGIYINTLAR
jgi:hypothetical protein